MCEITADVWQRSPLVWDRCKYWSRMTCQKCNILFVFAHNGILRYVWTWFFFSITYVCVLNESVYSFFFSLYYYFVSYRWRIKRYDLWKKKKELLFLFPDDVRWPYAPNQIGVTDITLCFQTTTMRDTYQICFEWYSIVDWYNV